MTLDKKYLPIVEEALRKCALDPAFRASALRDPKAALEKVHGAALPGDLKIRFSESTPGTITYTLPDLMASGELGDDDLEAVAGGDNCNDGTLVS
jgi:hypothetical protein